MDKGGLVSEVSYMGDRLEILEGERREAVVSRSRMPLFKPMQYDSF